MKRIILAFIAMFLLTGLFGQPSDECLYDSLELMWLKQEQAEPADAEKIKTWKLPVYMQENLQWMLNDFNKRFQEKVDSYEKELRIRFEEFRDMPEDVVLDIEAGIFIERSDFVKLQDQLRRKTAEEQIKKGGKEK